MRWSGADTTSRCSLLATRAPEALYEMNNNNLNPKDATGARAFANMSQVTGFVVYTAGDLVLLRIPMEPATGQDNTAVRTPDRTMAVVRLPDGCTAAFSDGTQVTAVGIPTTQGILTAEQVQISQ
jgi:hypothetical protein